MIFCPYCNNPADFSSSLEFYGKDYGTNVHFCRACDAHINTVRRTNIPNGTMANKALRYLRSDVHFVFDNLIKNEGVDPYLLTKKICQHIHLTPDEFRISYLDDFQCEKILLLHEKFELQKGTY